MEGLYTYICRYIVYNEGLVRKRGGGGKGGGGGELVIIEI